MPGDVLAHAFVEVHAKVDGFARELRRDLHRALGDIEPDARRAGQSLDRDLGGGFRKARREARLFDRDGVKSLRSLRGEIFNSNIRLREMANILGFATFPALVSLGSIGVPAVLALSAALASASGAAAALGPSIAAIAQGVSVVKLATAPLKDAFKALAAAQDGTAESAQKFKEELDKLPAPARRFVQAVARLAPMFREIREAAQKGLFPGLEAAVRRMPRLFELFRQQTEDTARVIGELAQRGAELITSGPWRRDLTTILQTNVKLLESFGSVALSLADVFRNLLAAAGPMTLSLAQMAAGWASNTAAAIEAARQSGKLGAFFKTAGENLRLLLRIAGNVGGTLGAVFSAALPSGGKLLESLEAATGRMRDLATSSRGLANIREFFDRARPAIETITGLLVQFARHVFEIVVHIKNATEAVSGFLAQHPQLAAFVTQALALALAFKALNVAGIAGIVSSVVSLVATTGPLGIVVGVVAALAGAFLFAYNTSAPFKATIDGLAATISAQVLPALHSFGAFLREEVIPAIAEALVWVRDQLVGGLRFLSDSVKQNQGNLRVLGTVLLTVGKFIATVVLPTVIKFAGVLLTVLVVAIGVAIRVLGISVGAFRSTASAVRGVIGVLASAAGAFGRLVSAVVSAVSRVLAVIGGLPGQIRGALGNLGGVLFSAGVSIITGLISGIRSAAGAVAAAARSVVSSAISAAKSALHIGSPSKVFDGIGRDVTAGLIQGLDAGHRQVAQAAGRLTDALGGAPNGRLQVDATAATAPSLSAGRAARGGVHVENLIVQPLSGRFRLADVMTELALQGVR